MKHSSSYFKRLTRCAALLYAAVSGTGALAQPVVGNIYPVSGSPGSTIALYGSNFNTTAANNHVYFGATKAIVVTASSMELDVTVPTGATYAAVSVTDATTGLTGYSYQPFLPGYDNTPYVAGTVAFDPPAGLPALNDHASTVDLDGDGKADVISVYHNLNSLAVFRNMASAGTLTTGSFSSRMDFTCGTGPVSVATGDIDGDGKPDVVIANKGANTISVLKNTSTPGTISFAAKVDFATGTQPNGVAIRDMDMDGKPDVVVTSQGDNTVSIFANTVTGGTISSGALASPVTIATGTTPVAVRIEDIDADGMPDMAVLNNGSSTVSLYKNIHAGGAITASSFAAAYNLSVNGDPISFVIADFNNDYNPDIAVVSNIDNTMYVFGHNLVWGSIDASTFAAPVIFELGGASGKVAVGDFDGDGKADITVSGNLLVFRNVNPLTPIDASSFVRKEIRYRSNSLDIAVGDLDGDGKSDIICGKNTGLSLLRNDPYVPEIYNFYPISGQPGSVVSLYGANFNSTAANNLIYFGAVQGTVVSATSTSLDVVVPPGATYDVISVRNTSAAFTAYSSSQFMPTYDNTPYVAGTVSFDPRVNYSVTTGERVVIGDIDGDGKSDMVSVGNGNGISISRNISSAGTIGAGSFAAPVYIDAGAQLQSLVLTDIDGDGKLDIAATNSLLNEISMYRNTSSTGSVSFSAKVTLNNGVDVPRNIIASDVNRDGKPDLIVCGGPDHITIHYNSCVTGVINVFSFEVERTYPTGNNPSSIAVGDIDQDGWPDIVVANRTDNNVYVLANDRSTIGGFLSAVDFPTGNGPHSVVVADINADYLPDIVVTNEYDNTISVLRHANVILVVDPTTFDAPETLPLIGAPNATTKIADLDGDSRPDIIVPSGHDCAFFRNISTPAGALGASAFSGKTIAYSNSFMDIAAGDMDGDGKADLVACDIMGMVSVLRNDPYVPVVYNFWPVTGSPGTTVTLYGSNFDPIAANNTVYFGTTKAIVTSASTLTLDVTVPVGATYAPISVYNNNSLFAANTAVDFLPGYNNTCYRNDTVRANGGAAVLPSGGSSSMQIITADMDGDGKLDLVIPEDAVYNVSIYRNIGTAGAMANSSFAPKETFMVGINPSSLVVTDIDGDGKPDLIAASNTSNTMMILGNTSTPGALSFSGTGVFYSPSMIEKLVAGDFDGDGKMDIAASSGSDTVISVFRNTATRGIINSLSMSDAITFPAGASSVQIAAGDLDLDGRCDLVVGNAGMATLSVLHNNTLAGAAVPHFEAPVAFAAGVQQDELKISDIDADFLPDIVVLNNSDNVVSVYKNGGTYGTINAASFAARTDFAAAYSFGMTLGDVNGDGKPDLVFAGPGTPGIGVMLNNASAGAITASTFGSRIDFAPTVPAMAVAVADMDGDQITDFVAATSDVHAVVLRSNPLGANPIGGATAICVGQSDYVYSMGYGTWTSGNTSVADVDMSSGMITAVSAGTATITFSGTSGCVSEAVVTVDVAPAVITGTTSLCAGSATFLSDAITGGSWSSSNTAVATAAADGTINGISPGVATITYSMNAGCYTTIQLSVGPLPLPAAIGNTSLCEGGTTILNAPVAGGTWSSSNTSVVTVGSNGLVTAMANGSAIISYEVMGACGSSYSFTSINVGQPAIWEWAKNMGHGGHDGAGSVNRSTSSIATDNVGNSYITGHFGGTVDFGGITVSASMPGEVFVAKYNATGTAQWVRHFGGNEGSGGYGNEGHTLDIDAAGNVYLSGSISGTTGTTVAFGSVGTLTCIGRTEIFLAKYDQNGNEQWVLQPTGTGTFPGGSAMTTNELTSLDADASGNFYITGSVPAGRTIQYGSSAVISGPAVMGGPIGHLARGEYVAKFNSSGNVIWITSLANPWVNALAIHADVAGNSYITGYFDGASSFNTVVPTSYTPVANKDLFVAKVSLTGDVSWVIQYPGLSTGGGPNQGRAIDVDATGNIYVAGNANSGLQMAGTTLPFAGMFVAKFDAAGTPLWLQGSNIFTDAGAMKLDALGEPVVTGSMRGPSCFGSKCLPYTGNNSYIAKFDATGNAVWASGSAMISGVYPGYGSFITGISFDGSGACYIAGGLQEGRRFGCNTIGNNGSPDILLAKLSPACMAILPGDSATVCPGSTVTLTDADAGGTWTSGSANATVDAASGIVTGMALGTAYITYTTRYGCMRVTKVNVGSITGSGAPIDPISGGGAYCVSSSFNLWHTLPGGTWSSTDSAVIWVHPTIGYVNCIAPGTATITYSVATGCGISTATTVVTVNAHPDVITGASSVCAGATTTFSCPSGGGAWYSAQPGIATVDSLTGIVTGVTPGTAYIYYSVGYGCESVASIEVGPLPLPAIVGNNSICAGGATQLNAPVAGGTWSSALPSVATVSSTGMVTGVASGTTPIPYSVMTPCGLSTAVIMMNISQPTQWEWARTMGSTGFDHAGEVSYSSNALTTDNSGNSYVCGAFSGTASFGGISLTAVGSADAFVAKYNSAGVVLWVKQVGADIASRAMSVGVDNSGNVYLGGALNIASGNTLTFGSSALAGTGYLTTFVAKYDGSGNEQWATQPSVTYSDVGMVTGSMYTDGAGNCYVTGSVMYGATLQWGSSTAITPTVPSVGKAYMVKISPAGVPLSTTVFGEALGQIACRSIKSDAAGNVLIAGAVHGDVSFATSPAATSFYVGVQDGFVAKINASSTVQWIQHIGYSGVAASSPFITVKAVDADASGNIYIGGTFTNGVTIGSTSFTNPATTMDNSFIAKFDAAGNALWAKCNRPTGSDYSRTSTLKLNAAGEPVLTGDFNGTISFGSNILTELATVTMFVAKYDVNGNCNWAVKSTGAAYDPNGIGMDGSGSIYVAFNHSGSALFGCNASGYSGNQDAGVAKLTVPCTAIAPSAFLTACIGNTATATDAEPGGIWTAGSTVASVDPVTGEVTTYTAGTANITYTSVSGCMRITLLTVNPLPATISGGMNLCVGTTSTLTDATAGGTWSSDDAAIAGINTATGVVTGVAAGTVTISYTSAAGCVRTTVVTVQPGAGPISGPLVLCAGATSTLTGGIAGGTWTSSTVAATIGSATGIVTGVASGTTRISYSLGAGCTATAVVTVNPIPNLIGGATAICSGNTLTLTNTFVGGAWSSGNTAVGTISATGVVTGVAGGTVVMSYTLPTGCFRTTIVTVNQTPAAITGTAAVCVGSTTTLANPVGGGTWAGSNGNITIGTATGIVTGIAAGGANVTYTTGPGCRTVQAVTINALPGNITGASGVCVGSSTTLADATTGGTWNVDMPSLAAISASGVVTGNAAGVVTVSYTLGTGCYKTKTVSVNPAPSAISGSLAACPGSSVTLTNSLTGGVWSSPATAVVSVGSSSGAVVALAAGVANITYTMPTGCISTAVFTVNGLPANITGTAKACSGTSSTLADATSGGTWSSSNTSVANADPATGVVTGVAAGICTITYSMGTGCFRTTTFTVNPNPAPISGSLSMCPGATTALSDPTSGGLSWTSSNTTVASINASSGIVTGNSAGTANITYTVSTGCYVTAAVTVNPQPTAIIGTATVCAGSTVAWANSVPGGTWSSANAAVATVGSSSGIVTGVAAGTARITFTSGVGCYVTKVVTVNAAPAAISGNAFVCIGFITSLTDGGGGTWSSSNTAVATVPSGNGAVSGVSAGTATITYTLATGCFTTLDVTVYANPAPITGTGTVCKSSVTTLSDATPSGIWTSSNTAVATVVTSTGAVTGVGAGTARITFQTHSGCYVTTVVTVNATPSAITGTMSVCAGAATTLTNSSGTGVWSSTNTAVGTVGSISAVAGRVAGLSAGTTTISFTFTSNGCAATAVVTVNATPIAGVISSSAGFVLHTSLAPTTATFSSSGTAGGTWSSNNSFVASVGAGTGNVSAVSPGVANISYTVTSGSCTAFAVHTVSVVSPRPGQAGAVHDEQLFKVDLFPNPNSGAFTIKGVIEGMDGAARIEVVNMTGQSVYSSISEIRNEVIDEHIVLGNDLANGMYLLTVRTEHASKVLHVILTK